MFAGNSVWQLVTQSDAVSKIVLIILCIMSVACWTIFLYKIIMLHVKKRHMREALRMIQAMEHLEQLKLAATAMHATVPGTFLARNLTHLATMLARSGSTHLSESNWHFVQANTAQIMDDMISQEESYLSFLSTCAGVAPLLGLFGTVWGLVHAFIRISELQSADIVAVAPGISEALITTLVGLIVAIPAMVMYNYLVVEVRALENQFINIADRFHVVVHQLLER